jgi:uncharacterized membrane protein YkvA (DUF1232 family)
MNDYKFKQIDKTFVINQSKKINGEDVNRIVRDEEKIKTVCRKGILKRYLGDIVTLITLLNDYVRGNYKKIPFKIIAAIAFTLVYILNPVDLIPDVLPFVGQLDDLAVLTVCLTLIEDDLTEYEVWKASSEA